jgi:hypothetical protein
MADRVFSENKQWDTQGREREVTVALLTQYEEAFAAMERERVQALVVLKEPINQACWKKVAEFAAAPV